MRKGRQKHIVDDDDSFSIDIKDEEPKLQTKRGQRKRSQSFYSEADEDMNDVPDPGYHTRKIKPSSNFTTLSYDNSGLNLKANHADLPLYVGNMIKKFFDPDPQKQKNSAAYEYIVELFLESFNCAFKEGYEFVSLIAEPRSRQEFIQSFEINAASLYASVTLGFTAEDIISRLEKFNKFDKIPNNIKQFIEDTTASFGKCRLVLKENNYFLESDHRFILEYYYEIKGLADCWQGHIYKTEEFSFSERDTTINESTSRTTDRLLTLNDNAHLIKCFEDIIKKEDTTENEKRDVYRLMIKQDKIDKVRIERGGGAKYKYMLSQEYIFDRNGESELDINLKSNVRYCNKNSHVPRRGYEPCICKG